MVRYDDDEEFFSELIDTFPYEAEQYERLRKPSPKRSAKIEPRRGPWSGNNQLGSSIIFAAGVTYPANVGVPVLKLDEWGMPETWTILTSLDRLLGDASVKLYADIEYGSGGITQSFTVDWLEIVGLPMNACKVSCRPDAAFTPASKLVASCILSRGIMPHSMPRYTINETVTTPDTTGSLIAIPKGAYSVSIIPANPTSVDNIYRTSTPSDTGIQQLNGATELSTIYGADLLSFPQGVPVSPNATHVQFFQDTSMTTSFAWVFGFNL